MRNNEDFFFRPTLAEVEDEEALSCAGGPSWQAGVPWLKKNKAGEDVPQDAVTLFKYLAFVNIFRPLGHYWHESSSSSLRMEDENSGRQYGGGRDSGLKSRRRRNEGYEGEGRV